MADMGEITAAVIDVTSLITATLQQAHKECKAQQARGAGQTAPPPMFYTVLAPESWQRLDDSDKLLTLAALAKALASMDLTLNYTGATFEVTIL